MAGRRTPGAPFGVLMVCAPEDAPAMGALARRLQADGMSTTLVAGTTTPRALREALAAAEAIVICLSHRALPDDRLAPALANVLEMLALAPAPGQLLLALRLTSCELPPALQGSLALDLFSARGYDQLLARLRDHAAAITPAPEPPPPEPEPQPATTIPALTLRGAFSLPLLDRQGQVRRLGRGVARAVFLVDQAHALVVSGGGPTLIALDDGQPLWTIDCPTHCAALSPGGRLLALAAGTQIFLWDLADGGLRGICTGHSGTISGLAFAPDERTLASVSHDRSLRLWRTGDEGRPPAPLATLTDHGDQVTSVAFSPDGTLVVAGGADRTVRVWRTLDRSRVQTLAGHGGAVEALAFGGDGGTLATGSRGRQARLWDTHTWRTATVLEGHEGAIETLAISPDGTLVATGAADNTVRLWRRADGALLRVLAGHSGPVIGLAFSPDSAALASVAEDERLIIWQVADGSQQVVLHPLSARVTSLALSPGGEQLAIGSSSGSLALYSLGADPGTRQRQNEHRGAILGLAFTGPTHVVTASADRTLRMCSVESGASSIMLQTHGALHVASLAPGGQLLASSDGENTVQLWRLASPSESPGGTFWRVLRGLQGRPRLVAFAPRAQSIAVAADDGRVRLWHLASLEREGAEPDLILATTVGHTRSLAFSADGALLAVGGERGAVQIWRTTSGAEVSGRAGAGRATTSLAFAPDGRSLAAGDTGGAIQIIRIDGQSRRRPPPTLLAHAGAVEHLAFGPGGRLVSGSSDGTIRVWRV